MIATVEMPEPVRVAIQRYGGRDDESIGECVYNLSKLRMSLIRQVTTRLIEPLTNIGSFNVDAELIPPEMGFAVRYFHFAGYDQPPRIQINEQNADRFALYDWDNPIPPPRWTIRIDFLPTFILINGVRYAVQNPRADRLVFGALTGSLFVRDDAPRRAFKIVPGLTAIYTRGLHVIDPLDMDTAIAKITGAIKGGKQQQEIDMISPGKSDNVAFPEG